MSPLIRPIRRIAPLVEKTLILMIRPILKYGSRELVTKSSRIADFDDELKILVQDMLETMYAASGIGLAAPQLGVNLRVIVIDVRGGQEQGHQIVLVNPEIVEQQGLQKGEEGCLSIPGFTAVVERPYRVRVVGQDLEGKRVEFEGEELLARALCHEVDHVEGILYLDRVSFIKKDLIRRKIRKLVRGAEW